MTNILPRTDDPDTAPFWRAARERRLVVQECDACGHVRFPPHPYCPACRNATHRWREAAGYGRVWTYAFVYKPTLSAFAPYTPFPIAYIELEDLPGVRMTGNLVAAEGAEINSVPHDQVRIGLRVKAVFADVADDVTMPRWAPVAEGAA
jgi:uncharacterized protein